MYTDPEEALRVEAHEHHVLAPEAVGERAEYDAAKHHAAKVDRRHHGGDEGAVAHQAPLQLQRKMRHTRKKNATRNATAELFPWSGAAGRVSLLPKAKFPFTQFLQQAKLSSFRRHWSTKKLKLMIFKSDHLHLIIRYKIW